MRDRLCKVRLQLAFEGLVDDLLRLCMTPRYHDLVFV